MHFISSQGWAEYAHPEIGEEQRGICTFVTSLSQCEVIPDKFYESVLSIMDQLNKLAADDRLATLRPLDPWMEFGRPIAAKYSLDDNWYRAKIVGKEDGKIVVQYVDFGNAELVSLAHIRELPRSLMDLPRAAISCHLKGVNVEEHDEGSRLKARNWLEDYVCEEQVVMKVEHAEGTDIAREAQLFIRQG